jgi:hypothetical protein
MVPAAAHASISTPNMIPRTATPIFFSPGVRDCSHADVMCRTASSKREVPIRINPIHSVIVLNRLFIRNPRNGAARTRSLVIRRCYASYECDSGRTGRKMDDLPVDVSHGGATQRSEEPEHPRDLGRRHRLQQSQRVQPWLAKEGALFTDFYGQRSCTAGRQRLSSGKHPRPPDDEAEHRLEKT